MKRTVEFIFGLIGGIIGFICALAALFIGGIGEAFNAEGAETVGNLGVAAIVFSIIAIIGAALVKSKPKFAGVLFVISAIGGFISISMFYILPGILILIAGIMALFKKEQEDKKVNT